MPPDKQNIHHLTPRMLRFLERQRVTCKESTIATNKIGLRHLCHFLKQIHKDTAKTLGKLTTNDLVDYMCRLNSKKLKPYTRVNYLLIARLYLAWEAEQDIIKPDALKPLDRSRLPRVPEYLPRPLSAENDRILLERLKASQSPCAPMFLLLRYTGMRISELINLPWNPIVTNDNKGVFLKVPLGKMDNERMVPLHSEARELIQNIKDIYPIHPNHCDQNRLIGLKGPVCNVRAHLYRQFKKIVGDMKDQEKRVTFHRLRHTYATSLLTAGVSIVSLMKLLGHRRIEMSLRYAKVTPEHLRTEYLKAIAVIENQVGLEKTTSTTSSSLHHPSEIVCHLKAYTNQSAKITTLQKKNLLRKLNRLKTDFDLISYRHPFKIRIENQRHT